MVRRSVSKGQTSWENNPVSRYGLDGKRSQECLSPEKIVALKNPEEIVFFSHALVGKSGTIRLCSACGLDRQSMVDFGVGFWCGHWLKAI
jgi:hypothetical protein